MADYLTYAKETMNFINSRKKQGPEGIYWSLQDAAEGRSIYYDEICMYAGASGIICFLLGLYDAAKDESYLEEADAARLLAALHDVPPQYSAMVQLGLFTGMRRGEICGLRWSDIDFNASTISVNRTVEYIPHEGLIFTAPKTKASNRTFKVGANCMDMLREYQLYQKAERLRVGSMWARTVQVENGKTVQNDLLFTSWDGTPFDLERLTTWFPHFLRAHDLPAVHFHSLRHTYASLMIAAHVPITTVSGRLGHAQTSTTTDIYAGFIRTADAAASDAMEIVFDNIREKSRA